MPPVSDEEIPFEIPRGWKWCRLEQICSIINGDRGKNYPAKSTLKKVGIPFISALNLNGVNVSVDEKLLCVDNEQYERLGSGKLEIDDIVICIRGSLGKHGRYQFEKGAIASSLVICRFYTERVLLGRYEMLWLDSSMFPREIGRYNSGTAQPNLAAENLAKFLFPLPPLAEQKRIVERVEEIFKLLDIIDEAQEKYSADAEILKSKLISMGIQGKLTEQLESDGTAEELFEQIQQEKQRLIKEGKIKKERYIPVIYKKDGKYYHHIEDGESVHDDVIVLPKNWIPCSIVDISYSVGTKENQVKSNEIKTSGLYPVISQGSIEIDGYCDYEDKVISNVPLILFGDHTKNVKMITTPFVIGADGTKLHKTIMADVKFVYFWMLRTANTIPSKGYARHYNLLKNACLALPPLAEQKRIADKLDEILRVIG